MLSRKKKIYHVYTENILVDAVTLNPVIHHALQTQAVIERKYPHLFSRTEKVV